MRMPVPWLIAALTIAACPAIAAEPPTPATRPGPVARGLADDKAVAAFYRPDEVQAVYLHVAEADLRRMLAALPELVDVPASFRWRDTTIENVAVRFKGNSSSNPKQPHKRSFLIKFDKYDQDRRFFGLRQVSFDNGVQFGSLFSEPVITDILRDHGIPAHRCNYARLYVNDEYRGVYVNVERVDESFIERHLPDPLGALFKVDEGGPGCNLSFLGDDPALYLKTFAPKTRSAKKDSAQLVEFIKLINRTDPKEFAKALESKMEVDDFLRITAVLLLAGAFDQLTGWNPHNYFLYRDGKRNRWRYLPWDLDVGFCETAFDKIRVLTDWHASWPVPVGGAPNPLLERIVADPVLLGRYRTEARKILEKSFEPERLCKLIDTKYQLIKDDLKTDPFPHRRATVPGDRSYDDIVNSMKAFVRARYASAVEQWSKRLSARPTPPRLAGPTVSARSGCMRPRRTGGPRRPGPAGAPPPIAGPRPVRRPAIGLGPDRQRKRPPAALTPGQALATGSPPPTPPRPAETPAAARPPPPRCAHRRARSRTPRAPPAQSPVGRCRRSPDRSRRRCRPPARPSPRGCTRPTEGRTARADSRPPIRPAGGRPRTARPGCRPCARSCHPPGRTRAY
jgi:CotH kinase protein